MEPVSQPGESQEVCIRFLGRGAIGGQEAVGAVVENKVFEVRR